MYLLPTKEQAMPSKKLVFDPNDPNVQLRIAAALMRVNLGKLSIKTVFAALEDFTRKRANVNHANR